MAPEQQVAAQQQVPADEQVPADQQVAGDGQVAGGGNTAGPAVSRTTPLWVLVVAALAVVAAVLGALGLAVAGSLPERNGPPVEQLAVERTVLEPGAIVLTVRGTGADPVQVAQVFVNDAFVDFTGGEAAVSRLETTTLRLDYPWQDGQPYVVGLLTSSGLVIEHQIAAAVATPTSSGDVLGLMVLLGVYVGVLPVALGMTVLPVLRRAGPAAVRWLLALTVGLLVFLALDAGIEALDLGRASGGAFGGPTLVLLGAALAFLALTAVDRTLKARRAAAAARPSGLPLAVAIAVGIGLHNLGEGLAIGSAYAVGELALGASLVVGFALHNTTEGLAVVSPLARERNPLLRLVGLGLLAGGPTVLGALIGVSVDNGELSAFLLGLGIGAIVQVVLQIVPGLRTRGGPALTVATTSGIAAGLVVMYATGLLVAA